MFFISFSNVGLFSVSAHTLLGLLHLEVFCVPLWQEP